MIQFDQSDIRQAARLSHDWHEGQIDRDGALHSVHCGRVAQQFTDSFLQVCAYLHDIFEDTNISHEEVACNFGWKVVEVIDRLTKREEENYEQFIKRICVCPFATAIKIADIKDNLARPDSQSFPKHDLYLSSLQFLTSISHEK